MMRGSSLEQDLRLLINNPKYSDIEILCGDDKKLYGCRAILAARSEVFDRLLYNGMKESFKKQISFPEINSSEMNIILEYTLTGSLKEESLTKDNIVEAFYAADYFQLSDLQDFIIKTVKNHLKKNNTKNYSPELLSKVADRTLLLEDDLLNLLVEAVANIPLNDIEFDRLSIEAFQRLLSCTLESQKPFATSEYEVLRYSAILAAKQVSNDAYKTLTERLPTLEEIKNSFQVESKSITDHQKVAKELEPLIKFIDFRRIRGQLLADIIEPLEIIPVSIYQHVTLSINSDLDKFRGVSPSKFSHVWDETACGSGLIIEDNGKVVHAQNNCRKFPSVRAKMILEDKGIFEWDITIEKVDFVRVGVCASENFNYEISAGNQPTGWVLDSGGLFWNSRGSVNYCPRFGDGTTITVHLYTSKRTLAFTVNDTKYPEVSCHNLPPKLYPVVSLGHSSRIRIQPH